MKYQTFLVEISYFYRDMCTNPASHLLYYNVVSAPPPISLHLYYKTFAMRFGQDSLVWPYTIYHTAHCAVY